MSSSSPVPARPENVTSAPATASNTFHVLNSAGGAVGAYVRPPHAAALRSPQARPITGYGYPATGVVGPANAAMVARAPGGQLGARMEIVQQLMHLAGWGNLPSPPSPWLHNYAAFMSPRGQPLLLSPSARPPGPPIRAPSSSFASGAPGASGSSVAGRGAVVVHGSAVAGSQQEEGAACSNRWRGATPAPCARHADHGWRGGRRCGEWPRQEARAKDKDKDSSKPKSSKKPRQRAASKQRQRTAGDNNTVAAADAKNLVVENQPPASNDLQIVPVLPPPTPSNRRKRKQNVAASPSSGGRCNVVARRSSAVAATAKKHTILTWLIDAGFLSDREKVFYVPMDGGDGKVVSGAVTRTGVHCGCCDAIVPLPAFEAHAGRDLGQQRSWEKLLLVSGSSLLNRMQEAWEKERVKIFLVQEKARAALEQEQEKSAQAKRRLLAKQKKGAVEGVITSPRIRTKLRSGEDSSDDACGVGADGGELLCCDSCPSTFHPACLAMKVPEGSWACHYCRCVLCMANGDQGLSTCQHCTLKYHEICRPSLSNGRGIGAYCSETCKKVSAQLADTIGVTNHSEDGFSWALLKIQKDEPVSSQNSPDVLECNVKLAVALGVLNECFNPVKDRRTKIDMLHQAVYSLGSEFKRVSYEGFYTMILEKDGEIISAALLRIHGTKVAEMPFAGTLPAYRKQGMMRRLVNAVEQVLASVQVEKLVIPAIAAMVDTWKRSFSFRPLDPESREETKRRSLVVITGTTLLHKPVAAAPPSPSPHKQTEAAAAKSGAEPWWWKYTYGAPPLTDDERAFLETNTGTAPLGCSFTDLVTGKVSSLHKALCAGNSSTSVPCCSSGSLRGRSWERRRAAAVVRALFMSCICCMRVGIEGPGLLCSSVCLFVGSFYKHGD
ncbi:unnamed protein product [Miscanthus lutarioriparius]|uniref:N-acetyltransferase domain-containing protein n=1 Tax=Miscanthus lutarioriparius TaxID=422564 RepID=A0A811P7J1_9POAL|nr:unnamed protein product [Miscanthus lutarioriparius]